MSQPLWRAAQIKTISPEGIWLLCQVLCLFRERDILYVSDIYVHVRCLHLWRRLFTETHLLLICTAAAAAAAAAACPD